jgi:hypothetical protein
MYVKSVFCRHDWSREEGPCVYEKNDIGTYIKGINVSATCTKCGWRYCKYWEY